MDVMATDEKPKPHPAYAGGPPPPPSHHPRMPPPDTNHGGLPPSHGIYEPPWRPYPPPFEGPNADHRRNSTPVQPPGPPHGYHPQPGRELPQLPQSVPPPYARPNSLPAPTHSPEAHPQHPPPYRPPLNGSSSEPAPHSGPPSGEYRPPMPYPPHHEGPPPVEQLPHPQPPPGPGPPGLPAPSYPPSHMNPMTPVPPTPGPYESSFIHGQLLAGRQRKAARAQQACDQCRARKAKCDEGRPACSHCKENSLICVYKEVPPHKQEKATQLLLDKLEKLEEHMMHFQSIQKSQGSQLEKLLASQGQATSPMALDVTKTSTPHQSSVSHDSLAEQAAHADSEIRSESDVKDEVIIGFPAQKVEDEAMVKDEDDGELSIPVEHTTAAHKLLLWPSIRRLISPNDMDEDYVMKLEEARGLIRVYGRGEGDDQSDYDRSAGSPSTANSAPSPNWNDDYAAHVGTPNPLWGVGFPVTVPPNRQREQVGGLDDLGQLNTDPETVKRLHKSYMTHLHILHPFLDENNLERKIDRFIKMYHPFPRKSPGGSYVPTSSSDQPRSAKRKRSSENLQATPQDGAQSPGAPPERGLQRRIERSIDNAIILFVLALGSICEWREKPLPGPLSSSMPSTPGSNSILSRTMSDSAVPPISNSFPSPDGADWRKSIPVRSTTTTGISAQEGSEHGQPKNMEVIPGFAYYAYGTDILGNLQGGTGLPHVQAALLAGLYAGQLAHPFQSHGWIFQASRACQVLVRSKRYESLKDGPFKDLCDFAYWTCLQLESDILAELDLPASGISRSEGRIALPKGVFTLTIPNELRAPGTMMMMFYSAQIHLRKVLNRVHTDLYKAEKKGQTRWSSSVQEVLSMNLELWRKSLPDIMKWSDRDPPSNDINTARMRAKYYGARYIIHRPLLYHALHYTSTQTDPEASNTVDSPAGSKSQQVSPFMSHSQRATSMSQWSSDIGVQTRRPRIEPWPGVPYSELSSKLQRACKICVDSAILSTEAFDGIKGRLLVTNIFGTAHAQFGNMLVLSATYLSSLSELVDRDVLQRLLRRTIDFLMRNKNISPSLRADAKILTEIYEKIFN